MPCALGLATPMSTMVATGRGATAGVLFKSAEAIETLRTATTLVVDKTGTLTEGKQKLVSIVATPGLLIAASLERASEHPLAAAIVAGAAERGVALTRVVSFASSTGKGVTGEVPGRSIALGNRRLLEDLEIDTGPLAAGADEMRAGAQTAMFLAIDGALAAVLAVADPVKETTPAAIEALHRDGLRVVMLTGDNRATDDAVARRLRIGEVVAEVLPDQKAEVMKRFQAAGQVGAIAGDGINDAPALAQAHVGEPGPTSRCRARA